VLPLCTLYDLSEGKKRRKEEEVSFTAEKRGKGQGTGLLQTLKNGEHSPFGSSWEVLWEKRAHD